MFRSIFAWRVAKQAVSCLILLLRVLRLPYVVLLYLASAHNNTWANRSVVKCAWHVSWRVWCTL